MSVAYFEEQRREMIAAIRVIAEHLGDELGKTALDDRVLRAMANVPRHEFVPLEVQPYACLNRPLPIGFDKTISQPLTVAVMTDLLHTGATSCAASSRPLRTIWKSYGRTTSSGVAAICASTAYHISSPTVAARWWAMLMR
jgi:Protein-L-isoaspartate(D-aspartate) O-methyltransferase (PCMT)